MDKIKFNEIDFSTLQRLNTNGSKGTLYRDDKVCFKLLSGLYPREKESLYKKFMEMDGLKIDNVLLPKDLIIKDEKLVGYTMDYFEDSLNLAIKYSGRYIDCKQLFSDLTKASLILKELHQHNIIYQDLSFMNILVNTKDEVAFCDIDSCSYSDHVSPFFSYILKRFIVNYRKDKLYLSENIDKISLMLYLCLFLYDKELQKLSKKQYHTLSDQIQTLENFRGYANILLDKNVCIYTQEFPYLNELIDTTDDYIVDREKNFSSIRKIVKRIF